MSPGPRARWAGEQDLRPDIDRCPVEASPAPRPGATAEEGARRDGRSCCQFAVIFVAELGDKSQLMALTFAARYKAVPILIGDHAATASVHLSVVVGGGWRWPCRPS